MISLKERDDVIPMCPHCDQPLTEVWYRLLKGMLGRRYVYFCAKCRKVLGVSHRKGFWMG